MLAVLYVICAGVPIWLHISERRAWKRLTNALRKSGIDINDLLKKAEENGNPPRSEA